MTRNASSLFSLYRNDMGQWCFVDSNGALHESVQVVLAFPLSAPTCGTAVVGADARELLYLPTTDHLPEALQGALRTAADERSFMPVIRRISSVSTFATPSVWQVETDRGATELVLKVEEDIRPLPGSGRLLITNEHGVVFEIADRNQLDRTSKRLLERFL